MHALGRRAGPRHAITANKLLLTQSLVVLVSRARQMERLLHLLDLFPMLKKAFVKRLNVKGDCL